MQKSREMHGRWRGLKYQWDLQIPHLAMCAFWQVLKMPRLFFTEKKFPSGNWGWRFIHLIGLKKSRRLCKSKECKDRCDSGQRHSIRRDQSVCSILSIFLILLCQLNITCIHIRGVQICWCFDCGLTFLVSARAKRMLITYGFWRVGGFIKKNKGCQTYFFSSLPTYLLYRVFCLVSSHRDEPWYSPTHWSHLQCHKSPAMSRYREYHIALK